MRSPQSIQVPKPEDSFFTYSEHCAAHIADAERELGAFAFAVGKLYGAEAAKRAAEQWLALAESVDSPLEEGRLIWRRVTVKAASSLVTVGCL